MSCSSYNGKIHELKKEHVDIFGTASRDGAEKTRRDAGLPDICTKPSPEKERDDARVGAAALAALVIVFTVAFMSLMYLICLEFNNEPYERAGGLMGEMMFGGIPAPDSSADVRISAETADRSMPPAVDPEASEKTSGDANDAVAGTSAEASITAVDTVALEESKRLSIDDDASLGDGFVDVAGIGADIDELVSRWRDAVIDEVNGEKLLIICTHSFERTKDGAYITEAAEAMREALVAAGVDAELLLEGFDYEGRLGAYARARAVIESRLASDNIGLIVDMHLGSEPGLYVGTRGDASENNSWERNAALAVMVNDALDTFRGKVFLDRGGYNQDLDVLTLHAEIDAAETATQVSKRARILANAILESLKPGR